MALHPLQQWQHGHDFHLQTRDGERRTLLVIWLTGVTMLVEVAAGYEKLRSVLEPWESDLRLHAKVVRSPGIIEGILQEARLDYDLMLIGGSNESYVDRMLFGSVPQTVAAEAEDEIE